MVGIASGKLANVEGDAGTPGKGQPEFLHKLAVKAADFFRGNFQTVGKVTSAGDIHGGLDQRLIHGQQEAAVAGDAALFTQSIGKCLTQTDANVLNGVVIINLYIALWLVGWMSYARLVRAEVMTLKKSEFIEAARVAGFSDARILLRHVLPNVISSSIVFAAIGFTDRNPTMPEDNVPELKYAIAFLAFGMIIIGLICNIVAMKFYPLTKEKMAEIQEKVAAIKAAAAAEEA